MQAVDAACFAPASLTPKQRLDCLRDNPADPSSAFRAHKLGFYTAGATLPKMKKLFDALPVAQRSAAFANFTQAVGMPRGGRTPLSSADFTKLKGWVLRGMPQLDEAAGGGDAGVDASDSGSDAGPARCVDSTTPELATHLREMKTAGWGARLADLATPMFGCGASRDARTCLSDLPDITTKVGGGAVAQTVRIMRQMELSSHYWVRSSADGRWVGFGMSSTSMVVDLSDPRSTPVTIEANYDPYFLPSNDGFAFAGVHADGGIHVCRQSLLTDALALNPPTVKMNESKCTKLSDDVYESIGTSLDGARYFVTLGEHENDDGGNYQSSPLPASFSSTATTRFIPMVNDGLAYRAQPAATVTIPGEGDVMLSPSSKLIADRFSGGDKQGGYRVRAVVDARVDGGLSVQVPLRAQVCMKGGKPSFSFDERFIVAHQYVDRTEADQAALPEKSSNIMIADLATGAKVRLTTMAAGQFALYPHFRADGWLYFIVRDTTANTEYLAATDAALRMGPR
jgi:hypothetical protein